MPKNGKREIIPDVFKPIKKYSKNFKTKIREYFSDMLKRKFNFMNFMQVDLIHL